MSVSSSCSFPSPSSSSRLSSPPADGRSSGCIPGILRCFGVIPSGVFEFDQFGGEEKSACAYTSASLVCGSAAPGIVARLMGLESVPEKIQIKASAFSDYQELQDEEFFILSFERGPKCRKRECTKGTRKVREEEEVENCVHQMSLYSSGCERTDVLCSGRSSCLKPRKGLEKNFESYCDNEEEPENSSPSSVLEFAKFPCDFSRSVKNSALSSELESCEERKADGEKIGARARNRGQFFAWTQDKSGGKFAAAEVTEVLWAEQRHHAEEIGGEIASGIASLLLDEVLISLGLALAVA